MDAFSSQRAYFHWQVNPEKFMEIDKGSYFWSAVFASIPLLAIFYHYKKVPLNNKKRYGYRFERSPLEPRF